VQRPIDLPQRHQLTGFDAELQRAAQGLRRLNVVDQVLEEAVELPHQPTRAIRARVVVVQATLFSSRRPESPGPA